MSTSLGVKIVPVFPMVCRYAIGKSEMLGKSPTDSNPPSHLFGSLVKNPIDAANDTPIAKSKVPEKKIMPKFLISDDFRLVTTLLKIKHGIIAVTIASLISRHVLTERIFLRARKHPNPMIAYILNMGFTAAYRTVPKGIDMAKINVGEPLT